jgi:hypothetical protein
MYVSLKDLQNCIKFEMLIAIANPCFERAWIFQRNLSLSSSRSKGSQVRNLEGEEVN